MEGGWRDRSKKDKRDRGWLNFQHSKYVKGTSTGRMKKKADMRSNQI